MPISQEHLDRTGKYLRKHSSNNNIPDAESITIKSPLSTEFGGKRTQRFLVNGTEMDVFALIHVWTSAMQFPFIQSITNRWEIPLKCTVFSKCTQL